MGIDVSVLDFVLKFKGKIKGETLQLGRQGFHIPRDRKDHRRGLAETALAQYDADATIESFYTLSGFSDALFSYLGSSSVLALDASPFEGANIVHDLNMPVDKTLHARFDTIFDGGTLEHVFDLPVALQNVKDMLRVGGLFLSVNAANNQVGHGFYQFSPELMWRVFAAESGFKVELMQLVNVAGPPAPVDVPDPAAAGKRLEIGATVGPTYLLVAARKIAETESSVTPQQSDYSRRWAATGAV